MFNPSAAPRWNSTTSFFLFAAAVVISANTLRFKKAGITEVPTNASAPPFIKPRRVTPRRGRPRPCISHPQSLQSVKPFFVIPISFSLHTAKPLAHQPSTYAKERHFQQESRASLSAHTTLPALELRRPQ